MKSNSIINSIIKRRLMKHTKKQSTGDTYPDGDVLLIRKLSGGNAHGHI